MGVSHAVSGMAAGAAALPWAPVAGVWESAAWVAAWGGYALLPDLDQGGITNGRIHGSTAARTWGPVTALMADGVGRVSGGHRNGTHSILGVAVFAGLAWLASQHPATAAVLLALSIGLALRGAAWIIPGRAEKVWTTNLLVSFGLAYWAYESGLVLDWLWIAVAGGCVAHILGDMLTPERCPLAWPVSKRRFGVGLFTTSTWIEAWIVVPGLAALTVWLLIDSPIMGGARSLVDDVLGPYSWVAVGVLALMAGALAMKEHGGARRGTRHIS